MCVCVLVCVWCYVCGCGCGCMRESLCAYVCCWMWVWGVSVGVGVGDRVFGCKLVWHAIWGYRLEEVTTTVRKLWVLYSVFNISFNSCPIQSREHPAVMPVPQHRNQASRLLHPMFNPSHLCDFLLCLEPWASCCDASATASKPSKSSVSDVQSFKVVCLFDQYRAVSVLMWCQCHSIETKWLVCIWCSILHICVIFLLCTEPWASCYDASATALKPSDLSASDVKSFTFAWRFALYRALSVLLWCKCHSIETKWLVCIRC